MNRLRMSIPEVVKVDSPTLGYASGVGMSQSRVGPGGDTGDDIVEDSEEERKWEWSSSEDVDVLPQTRKSVVSSSGVSLLPEVVERMGSLSYAESGPGSVHSRGCPRRLSSFHPYRKAEPRRDGPSSSQVQRRSSLISSEGSHCDCDHSEVESDGSYTSFLTDRSVDLGPLSHS